MYGWQGLQLQLIGPHFLIFPLKLLTENLKFYFQRNHVRHVKSKTSRIRTVLASIGATSKEISLCS